MTLSIWYHRYSLLPLSALSLLLTQLGAQAQVPLPLDDLVFRAVTDAPAVENLSSASLLQVDDTSAAAVVPGSSVAEQQREISRLEAHSGPWAEALMEVLLSLGELYQQLDEHGLALAAFERAEHLGRIHYGLHSPRLLPSVERGIDSLVAMGLVERADERHQYLLYLARKAFGVGAPEVLPVLVRLADWNMGLYRQTMGLDEGGKGALTTPFSTPPDRLRIARERLHFAQTAYLDAINLLVRQQAYADPRLLSLERRLIDTQFQLAYQREILYEQEGFLDTALAQRPGPGLDGQERLRDRAFRNGLESYARMLAYLNNGAGTISDTLDVLLERADWYMLFGKVGAGVHHYAQAERYLDSLDLSSEQRERLLNPELPVVMPVFRRTVGQGLDAEAPAGNVQGYVDLSFRLDRNGNARRLDVLGASPQTTRPVRQRLLRLLRESPFRPRMEEGKSRSRQFQLRYYYRLKE